MQKKESELIKKIDWEVERIPMGILNPNGNFELTGDDLLRRSDNKYRLNNGSVGKSFNFTNIKELEDKIGMFSAISGFPVLGWDEFAGGSKVICYLKSDVDEIGGFKMKDYLTLGTGFDGITSFFVGTSNILIRCQNQWGRILKSFKIKNTKNHKLNRDEAMKSFENCLTW